MGLKIQVTKQAQDVLVILDGTLDENCELPRFGAPIEGLLTLDLGGLESINSMGCRRWSNWINDVAIAKNGVRLVHCSPALVAQINVLDGFVPAHARVESFFVPFTCSHCSHVERVLLTRGREFEPGGHILMSDEIPCGRCRQMMTLDTVRERYFKFLAKKSA